MSVVIDMEFPSDCRECDLYTMTSMGYFMCLLDRHVLTMEDFGSGRDKGCPIICKLPNLHGRLIDVEELECDAEWSDVYNGYISYSQSEIDVARTVVPAEYGKEEI